MAPKKSTSPEKKYESQFSVSEMLVAEFEYIANSAFQANEDRSKAASFFLISVGSLVAAIFGAQQLTGDVNASIVIYRTLTGLFYLLSLLGLLTIAQLVRLRTAWFESAKAMNQMKTYLMEHFPEIGLKEAFRWRKETLPKPFKLNSISFFTALEVALLSGLTSGAGTFFLEYKSRCGISWGIITLAALGTFSIQVLVYWLGLRERKESEKKP